MPECTCYPTPPEMHFRYGDAVEPGSALEPNPDCREHFPVPELVGLIAVALSEPTLKLEPALGHYEAQARRVAAMLAAEGYARPTGGPVTTSIESRIVSAHGLTWEFGDTESLADGWKTIPAQFPSAAPFRIEHRTVFQIQPTPWGATIDPGASF